MKKIVSFLLIGILILGVTGCGSNSNKASNNNVDNTEKNDNGESGTVLQVNAALFNDEGYAAVSYTDNFTHYTTIIDKNFKVHSIYEYNATLIGKYVTKNDPNDRNTINIYDVDGNIVFSYKDYEYEKLELVPNGYFFATKKEDTYNASVEKTGVYSLDEKKWVVEPSSEYDYNAALKGKYVIDLKNDEQTFFNTKTGKLFKTPTKVYTEFIDGYATITEDDVINIYSDNGSKSTNKIPLYSGGRDNKRNYNGMYVLVESSIDTGTKHFIIFNLKNNKKIDLSGRYYAVSDYINFTKTGYALVTMTNQGGTPYYTVIDSEGKELFEPVKMDHQNDWIQNSDKSLNILQSNDLYEGDYIILYNKDNIYEVRDKNNKNICTGEEYERFEAVTNNSILVSKSAPGHAQERYYKNMDCKKIDITKPNSISIIK